jgi:GWxTD domain-containing protein
LSRFRPALIFLLTAVLLLSILPASAAKSEKGLAPNYRHWLDVEVTYIISSAEKKQFLSLTTDQERDSFIQAFWRVRNPDPGSDSNSYKEEHYRRLAYANEHFGVAKYENGWQTEMGRIYIILGKPKQRAPYHEKPNLRDMEIWFYEAETPVLPPYFYVLFYRRSLNDSYRLYSPSQDGPVALVTTGESQNDNKLALKFIRDSAGDEVAKTTCTLIPGESVDFDNFRPTMDSDMLLANINGLPDNPLTKERLEANRLREHVTTSILIGDQDMTISSTVLRDEEGRQTASYMLTSRLPDPRIIGPRSDGSFYYDLSLRTTVVTAAGKPVYDQEEQLAGKLTGAQAEIAKKKRFAAEGRLPLTPGTYTVIATLTNNVNHIATRQRASLTVPAVKSQTIGISDPLEYAAPAAMPDPQGRLPFSMSKLRFTPRGAQSVTLSAGAKLPIVFQLWLDPKTAGAAEPEKVHLHYVFGAVTASHDSATEENEDIDVTNRDKAGNILTGHTVDTSNLTVGTYRLVIGATKEGMRQTAYAAMTLHVERVADYADMWTAFGAMSAGGIALDDLKRGLSAESQGSDAEAQSFYARALAEGGGDARPLDLLAALLQRQGKNDDLAALSQQPMIAGTAMSPKTLLAISQGLTKTGNPKGVVRMLEAQIKMQPPNAELYRTLADACEATGNESRARDLRTLATGAK